MLKAQVCCGLLLFVTVLLAGCAVDPPATPASAASSAGRQPPTPPGPDDPPFTTTESGLKHRILREGDGARPTATNVVTVHYHGWLDDNTVFDSSYARSESTSFPLGNVIPGWTEGLQLVGKGGMIELEIPGYLAYGVRGRPPDIPPDATLHFIVELIEVK